MNFREFHCTHLENEGILSTGAILLIIILDGLRPGEAVGRTLDLQVPAHVSVPTGLRWPKHLSAFRAVSVQPKPGLCSVCGSVKATVIRPSNGSEPPRGASHTCQAAGAFSRAASPRCTAAHAGEVKPRQSALSCDSSPAAVAPGPCVQALGGHPSAVARPGASSACECNSPALVLWMAPTPLWSFWDLRVGPRNEGSTPAGRPSPRQEELPS